MSTKDLSRFRARFQKDSGAEAMQNLRHIGIRSMSSVQGLVVWNYLNLFLILMPLIVPLGLPIISTSIRYVMASALLCTAVSWWRLGVPIKMVWPIRFILFLQVWLTICSFLAMTQLGRKNDFETSNYFLIMAVIFYFQAVIFGHHWPNLRRGVVNTVLALFTISAIIGFAQFLKIGPALQIAAIYNAFQPIDAWAGGTGVRAIGLASWPEFMALQGLVGWAILVSRVFERPLKPWEFGLSGFLLLVGLMAQSRIMYVSLGIAVIAYLYILVKQDRRRGPLYLVIFLTGVMALFLFGSERLSYVLNTNVTNDPTLKYRQETGWKQAFHIIDERPWTGIGPDNRLTWTVSFTIPDKWTQGHYIDNGYLLLLSWGGIPALTLYMPIVFFAIGGSYLIIRSKKTSVAQKEMAFICLVSTIAMWNNMFLNNGFTHIFLNCVLTYFAGLTLPTALETREQEGKQNHFKERVLAHQKAVAARVQ